MYLGSAVPYGGDDGRGKSGREKDGRVTQGQADGPDTRVRVLLKEMVSVVAAKNEDRMKEIARTIWHEPFAKRTWSEFFFLVIGAPMAFVGIAFVIITLGAGMVLAVTFFGLAIIALSIRGARGIGGLHRQLARAYLGEEIADPEPFAPRPGFLGWLQSSLRDRTGWRAMAYVGLKVPLAAFGVLVGFAFWWDAFFCLTFPIWGGSGSSPAVFGLPQVIFGTNFFSEGHSGFFYRVAVFVAGIIFFFVAPWAVRGAVYLNRRVLRVLLAPDPLAARLRSLEQSRTQTVDSSAATLRRIERDLHDGTQAQLVALAMRLGMAKEKRAEGDQGDELDLVHVRQLVDNAHRGAKEAIVELRDLARGIHPPALDIGLE